MLLRELFEAPAKRAVLAFGRLNPPTVGHAKLVDTITSIEGDHYLFLSHTQKPKTDPLDFQTKLKFAKQFFPSVEVGHPSVRTPIQALEFLQSNGYTDIVFVAGSDRVEGFQKLFNTYNGQPDKTGKVPFKFNSIKVVSAGERDPDADDVSGMSASKMRALAAQGELESFARGVPDKKLAKTMYDAVRNAMGVKDAMAAEDASPEEEDDFHTQLDKLVHKYFGHSSDEKKKKKYDEAILKEFDVRNSKKYSKAETYKGYEIYVSVDTVLQGQHMAVAYDRAGKEAFRGKGRVPEQAANMIKDTIDGRQKSASKVQGNATIDFNAQFSREIVEPGMDKIYAKIVAGPKLIIANSEYYDDTDALVQMGFKPTAFRTKDGLLAIGMTAKQTQGAELIANGRYYVGDKSYDEFENVVYDLDFHSVVNDKNEKYSLGKPGLTVATRRT